jgi:hypothetical protein
MFTIAHADPKLIIGMYELLFVGLASVIILAILGPSLWRDFTEGR